MENPLTWWAKHHKPATLMCVNRSYHILRLATQWKIPYIIYNGMTSAGKLSRKTGGWGSTSRKTASAGKNCISRKTGGWGYTIDFSLIQAGLPIESEGGRLLGRYFAVCH
jgi:hypothetical protein